MRLAAAHRDLFTRAHLGLLGVGLALLTFASLDLARGPTVLWGVLAPSGRLLVILAGALLLALACTGNLDARLRGGLLVALSLFVLALALRVTGLADDARLLPVFLLYAALVAAAWAAPHARLVALAAAGLGAFGLLGPESLGAAALLAAELGAALALLLAAGLPARGGASEPAAQATL